ncbi:MAG: hypothetical protein IJF33_00980 [Clostridia bacterium]|nr:hypothetical protein [Clostridia bacterium]
MKNRVFALTAGAPNLNDGLSMEDVLTWQGMLVIACAIALLTLIIVAIRRANATNEGAVANAPVPNANDAALAAAIAAAIAANEDDGAVVAAITAAITAMRAEEGYTGGFRVVSFKRATPKVRRRF